MGDKINEKIDETKKKLSDLPNQIVDARLGVINKMILAEELRDSLSGALHTTYSGDTTYDIMGKLADQRNIMMGASAGEHKKFTITASKYTEVAASSLKTPTTTTMSFAFPDGFDYTTFSNTSTDPNYWGNFFLTKDTAGGNLIGYSDQDHIKSATIFVDSVNDISLLASDDSTINTAVSFSKVLYVQSDTEVAEIRVSSTRVGYIDKLGGVYTDHATIVLDEINSYFSTPNKTIVLYFTAGLTGNDLPVELVFEDDTTDYNATPTTEAMSFDNDTKQFHLTLASSPAPVTIQVWHNGTQVAAGNEDGKIVSLKINPNNTSFNSITDELRIELTEYDYANVGSEVVEVKYIPKSTGQVVKNLGTLKSSGFNLTGLTGSATFKLPPLYEDSPPTIQDTDKKILKYTLKVYLEDRSVNPPVLTEVATTNSAGTISGTYNTGDTGTITGTVTDYDITALTFDEYPEDESYITIKYDYLEGITTFNDSYTQTLLTSFSTSTSGTETINTLVHGAITILPKLGEEFLLRKKTDYSIWTDSNGIQATLRVICHGLAKTIGWSYTTSADGEDSLVMSHDSFTTLLGWVNPATGDDIIKSANNDLKSIQELNATPYDSDDATDIAKNPMFPQTAGTIEPTNIISVDYHHTQEMQDETDVVKKWFLVWSTLNASKWAFMLDPMAENGINDITPDTGDYPKYSSSDVVNGTGVMQRTVFPQTFIGGDDYLGAFAGVTYSSTVVTTPTISSTHNGDTVVASTVDPPTDATSVRFTVVNNLIMEQQSIEDEPGPDPPQSWMWDTAVEFTCFWNDLVNNGLLLEEVNHSKAQISKLVALRTSQSQYDDPRESAGEADAFWKAIGDFPESDMDTVNTEVNTAWALTEGAGVDHTALKTAWDNVFNDAGANDSTPTELRTALNTRLTALNTRIGVDATAGYAKELYDVADPMINQDIKYVKDVVSDLNTIESTYGEYVKNKSKLAFYETA